MWKIKVNSCILQKLEIVKLTVSDLKIWMWLNIQQGELVMDLLFYLTEMVSLT